MTGPQLPPPGAEAARAAAASATPAPATTSAARACFCDGGACAASEGGSGGDEPRRSTGPTDRFQRFTMDVGGGVGLAYLGGGRPPYAEYRRWQFVDGRRHPGTTQESCGNVPLLPGQVKAGFAPTYFLSALIRGTTSRGASAWASACASSSTRRPGRSRRIAPTSTAPNPPTHLGLEPLREPPAQRAALLRRSPPTASPPRASSRQAFAGGGVGQIEPSPPAAQRTTGRQPAHVLSGYGNARARVAAGVQPPQRVPRRRRGRAAVHVPHLPLRRWM
jgi:hypothetical protein